MPNLLNDGAIYFPDRSRLLKARFHFNPSLAVDGDRILMSYRRLTPDENIPSHQWQRELALCELDDYLEPNAKTNVDLSRIIRNPDSARRWHADARLFKRGEQTWFTYHDNVDLYAARYRSGYADSEIVPRPFQLCGIRRRSRERNWGCFDDGSFKAVYTIDPHIVLALTESETSIEARPEFKVERPIVWDVTRWGEPHGGSPPVLIGDIWFSFFHSNAPSNSASEKRVYRTGFYGFDARPPHPIRFMTPQPLLQGSQFPGPYSFWNDFEVVYPSGAVFTQGFWILSVGIHDRTLGLAIFRHEALLAECEKM